MSFICDTFIFTFVVLINFVFIFFVREKFNLIFYQKYCISYVCDDKEIYITYCVNMLRKKNEYIQVTLLYRLLCDIRKFCLKRSWKLISHGLFYPAGAVSWILIRHTRNFFYIYLHNIHYCLNIFYTVDHFFFLF